MRSAKELIKMYHKKFWEQHRNGNLFPLTTLNIQTKKVYHPLQNVSSLKGAV